MRKRLGDFLLELSGEVPAAVVEAGSGEGLGVETFTLAVPIESVIDDVGELTLSLPRGRLATGFDLPHGRLRVSFVRSEQR